MVWARHELAGDERVFFVFFLGEGGGGGRGERQRGKGREGRAHAQHVVHEGAAAGPDLDELDAARGAGLADPLGDEPQADELAKELRDVGRGGEVAARAEGLAAAVAAAAAAAVVAAHVARQTHAHVAGQRHGARRLFFGGAPSVSRSASGSVGEGGRGVSDTKAGGGEKRRGKRAHRDGLEQLLGQRRRPVRPRGGGEAPAGTAGRRRRRPAPAGQGPRQPPHLRGRRGQGGLGRGSMVRRSARSVWLCCLVMHGGVR